MSPSENTDSGRLVRQLITNTTMFQSKTVDLISQMSDLTRRMDRMLALFEDAAKHVSETRTTDEQINALAGKLEALLEQNKNVARGLLLLEQYVRGRTVNAAPKPLSEY
ncbi:MAG: hypothetical protein PHD81_03325 [Candidatus Nanoarchaeia archaeon]|nr:hypothetical protein [Candidatus Nanoarchaeia archaeon]MDD5588116.1 hypothetical protein [Candidatus Nanoarchaeia archaeon]